MKIWNVISLFIVAGIVLVCLLERKEGRGGGGNREKTEYGLPFLLLALYGMTVIRSIGLGEIPGGFNQDGAMGAVDALALSQYGTDRFGTWLPAHFKGWGYGQMSVLLSYLTVPFIKVLGLDSLSARLPMLFLSMAGAGAVYGIAKETVSPGAALCALLFLAVNPWHFMQSRWALDCNAFPHMFVIGLYFLIRGLSKNGVRKKKYLYLSMIFFALCMYAYGVSFYMVPFFLLTACIFLLAQKRIDERQALICMAVYFGVSFPIYGTMLINFMRWETVSLPFTTMPYFPDSIRSGDIVFFSDHPVRQLLSNLNTLVRVVFLQKPDLIWNAIDDFGTMYQCSMPLILAGVGISIYQAGRKENENRRIFFSLLLLYWGCSIFTGLCINNVNVNRINIIFYSHILFAGIALYYLAKNWKRAAAALALIYCLQSLLFFNRYFTVWAEQMQDMFYDDFLEAVEYAGKLQCDYYYITPDTPVYGASVQRNEILTMFAQKIDAEYYQGKTDRFMGNDIPYAQRYQYRDPSAKEVNPDRNAAYVVMEDLLPLFDRNEFEIRRFGDYIVAAPYR